MQMQQKKILWGTEIKKNNQRVLSDSREKKLCKAQNSNNTKD